jgi:glycosyltransferase involved in cell wall biosynthesis
MRIAIVVESLHRSGGQRQAIYATSELLRNGCDAELIYYHPTDYQYDVSILPQTNVLHLAKNKTYLRFLLKLCQYFKQRHFDVVHGWMGGSGIYASLAGRLAGVPVVFAGSRSEYDGCGYALMRFAHRVINKIVTGWIVNSRATVTSIVKKVGVNPDKVHVVYNGIDPEAFRSKLTPTEARLQLGLPVGCQTVSIVANFRAQKNHAMFVEMAALVHRELPDVRFLVVGDGEGDERAHLEAQSWRLGVRERMHFLGSRSNIPDILAATDIMTLTSHFEGVANSLMEAMCVGLPVVSTAYAGVEQLITHEHDGLIAPLGDAVMLASHVCRLLRDCHLRKRMGENGRDTICQRFNMQVMGRNLYAIYDRCLAESRC